MDPDPRHPDVNRSPAPRLEAAAWSSVHDTHLPRHYIFWRGLELARDACLAALRPGELWIDAGCGTGQLGDALSGRDAHVVGLDLDPNMARFAYRRSGGCFAAADVHQLPVEDGSCGGIVAVSLLGYLRDPARFFAEAARALRPGGLLCLTAMNRSSALLAVARVLSFPRRSRTRYTAHDPSELVQALDEAGFEVREQRTYGHILSRGDRCWPSVERAVARERIVRAGQRTWWARQVLIIACRRAGARSA
jgi:SAM-dependent methyltransferase